jgi:hypothetical protein
LAKWKLTNELITARQLFRWIGAATARTRPWAANATIILVTSILAVAQICGLWAYNSLFLPHESDTSSISGAAFAAVATLSALCAGVASIVSQDDHDRGCFVESSEALLMASIMLLVATALKYVQLPGNIGVKQFHWILVEILRFGYSILFGISAVVIGIMLSVLELTLLLRFYRLSLRQASNEVPVPPASK